MAFLPHCNENLKNEIIKIFSLNLYSFEQLNNFFFNGKCDFFFKMEKLYSKEAQDFISIYPNLQKLALSINDILPKELPILKTKDKSVKIEYTRKQVALIFLLSFFDFIEGKNSKRFHVYYILFNRSKAAFEFGRCFLNYLITIGKWLKEEKNDILEEKIIYKRINIEPSEYLEKAEIQEINLCEIKFDEENSMFNGTTPYYVDFANKYIGGGALTGGCVQEEILFAMEPEASVSMLFMEVMDPNDAIGIFNTIEYSASKGYGYDFKFDKSAITDDLSKIKRHRIIAIDAIVSSRSFFNVYNGYQKDIMRDIHKAYVGFNLINSDDEKDFGKIISTGNWGCGAFGGNHELKFIQQWIAASFAGVKRLDYYTFKNKKMNNAVKYYEKIKEKFKKAYSLYRSIVFDKIDMNHIIINLQK